MTSVEIKYVLLLKECESEVMLEEVSERTVVAAGADVMNASEESWFEVERVEMIITELDDAVTELETESVDV